MQKDRPPTCARFIPPKRERTLLYAPFVGHSGRQYLNTIIQRIIPRTLWQTWLCAVNALHPLATQCYLSTTELAVRAGRSARTIERDLQEFEHRGLLHRYADRRERVRQDGTTCYPAVIVKDFRRLYDLAYDYHLWCHSAEYIPPERAFVHFIAADRALCAKLIRFEPYRRLLLRPAKPNRTLRKRPHSHKGDHYGPVFLYRAWTDTTFPKLEGERLFLVSRQTVLMREGGKTSKSGIPASRVLLQGDTGLDCITNLNGLPHSFSSRPTERSPQTV